MKNGTPEIYKHSLSEVIADENLLSSIISEKSENEPSTALSLYASGSISENELCISWITNKDISDAEYKIFEINDCKEVSYVASTNDLSYVYELENNFETKKIYIEAYYNGSSIGRSNVFIVKNTDDAFYSELLDTDGDNISDYIEELIGTDINNPDTDGDGLDDYLEFFVVDLDPLKKDTDGNEISDDCEDSDGDGLTNLEELTYATSLINSDTDNDKLSDYDEIFLYNTNPLSEDTDNDKINDYDEIMLGINPNNNSDCSKIIDQKIEKESKCLSKINVKGMPYKVSMDIKASGYVEGSIKVDNSMAYVSTYSFDTIGEIPEFSYEAGNVDEVTINFEFEDDFIVQNDIDIDSLNVFKFYDEVNMFVPIKTFKNETTNILSCKSDSLGIYCIKDINKWILNFIDHDSEKSSEPEQISLFLEDSDNIYMSDKNDIELLSDDISVSEEEPVNIIFALDQTYITGALSGFQSMKQNVINVSERLFSRYKNANIIVMIYNYNGTYISIYSDINTLKDELEGVNYIRSNAQYLPFIETPIYYSVNYFSNLNPKYIFIYNGFMNDFNPSNRNEIEDNLKKEKDCHISFISGLTNVGIYDYISYYSKTYNGEMFNLYDDNLDNEVFNYIAKEPKLIRELSYIVPGDGEDIPNVPDTPDDPEPDPIETKPTNTYILSSNLIPVTLKAPITKNSDVNSDEDDLSDYEELIQDDKLIKWNSDGSIILPTLDEIIHYCKLYAGMRYLPDDILDNKYYMGFLKTEVLPVRCNPTITDTDSDGYTDSDEILNNNTNPLKYNKLISALDIDFLQDNMRYAATACRDYNQNIGVEISVLIANKFFGSTHDYKLIYKEQLIEYIKALSDGIQEKQMNSMLK